MSSLRIILWCPLIVRVFLGGASRFSVIRNESYISLMMIGVASSETAIVFSRILGVLLREGLCAFAGFGMIVLSQVHL